MFRGKGVTRPPESRSRRNVSSPSPLELISPWLEEQELGLLRLGTVGLFDKWEGGEEEGEEEGNSDGVSDEEGEEFMVVVIVLYAGSLPSVLGLVAWSEVVVWSEIVVWSEVVELMGEEFEVLLGMK